VVLRSSMHANLKAREPLRRERAYAGESDTSRRERACRRERERDKANQGSKQPRATEKERERARARERERERCAPEICEAGEQSCACPQHVQIVAIKMKFPVERERRG
jgi:hypothetical protein